MGNILESVNLVGPFQTRHNMQNVKLVFILLINFVEEQVITI